MALDTQRDISKPDSVVAEATGASVLKRNAGPIPFLADRAESLELTASPINPDWIISGNPQARSVEQSRTQDRASSTAVWDCTAGQFRWYFGWDETVYILEGSVTVATEDGGLRVLKAGDIGYFKAGTSAIWHVESYVKKVAFMRRPFPTWLALFYRIWGRIFSQAPNKL
jgi:uncharacterized cupin superfamily protein